MDTPLATPVICPSVENYVHGYSDREQLRLQDQARTLTALLHHDTYYPPGSQVLEAGCGVGAQTLVLTQNSPQAHFTAIDRTPESLAQAQRTLAVAGAQNVTFRQADIFDLPFAEATFDHIFVCFVLEHVPQPAAALEHLRRVLKPGGTLTVIEGDHDSAYFHPDSAEARAAIHALVASQARVGGNACIGRQIFPLLQQAGFHQIAVSPRMIYVDASRPELVDGFTVKTFIAMVAGVREQVLADNLLEPARWEQGIADLYRTTQTDGTFCYTFFKGVAQK